VEGCYQKYAKRQYVRVMRVVPVACYHGSVVQHGRTDEFSHRVRRRDVLSRRISLVLAVALMLAVMAAAPALAAKLGGADQGGRPFTTTLSGVEEVDPVTGELGAGDPDGSGSAILTVNPGQGEVCYELSVEDITLPAIGAHIHLGDAGEIGPVVVPLTPPDAIGASDAIGVSSGCKEVSRELALAIIQNPEDYYVNVHTSDFPGGAIRGQLSK
jgi:hypothetical protein